MRLEGTGQSAQAERAQAEGIIWGIDWAPFIENPGLYSRGTLVYHYPRNQLVLFTAWASTHLDRHFPLHYTSLNVALLPKKEQTQYHFIPPASTHILGTTNQSREAVTLSLHQALAESRSTLPASGATLP